MFEIRVLTASRAEYGLLRTLIFRLRDVPDFHVTALVTGMHLSEEFGSTDRQIEQDGIEIAARIPILLDSDTGSAVSKAMGLAMIGFADFFSSNSTDFLVVLGDRFETLAVCCAAFNEHIPIAHLHGGEITEGALDEGYRHAVTKLSYLHFTSTEEYRARVIQLGEAPDRVFNVGALGVENALKLPLPSREDLQQSLGFPLEGDYAVVTFHPASLERDSAQRQCVALIEAMLSFPGLCWLCTKANADAGGHMINRMLAEAEQKNGKICLVDSLGAARYLAAVRDAAFVLGNSSSGLLEVPSLGIPTVNIGDRQKGRIRADSVIDCAPDMDSIVRAIRTAMDPEVRSAAKRVKNPYQGRDTSGEIVKTLGKVLHTGIDLKKPFYDLPRKQKGES